VFDVIINYLDSVQGAKSYSEKLWHCCRFVHLSSDRQFAALQHDTFPRSIFCDDFIAFNALNKRDVTDHGMPFCPSIIKRVRLRNTPYLLRPSMIPNCVIGGNMATFSNALSVSFKLLPEPDLAGEFGIPEGWCVVKTTDLDFHLIRQNIIVALGKLSYRLIFVQSGDCFYNLSGYDKEGREQDHWCSHKNGVVRTNQQQNLYKMCNQSKLLVRSCVATPSNKRRRMWKCMKVKMSE